MMQELINQLNEPDKHFTGNFDTPKHANALLMCLCQEAAEAIKAQAAEIAKYKALCDQLGEALDWHYGQYADPESLKALEAWRAMK